MVVALALAALALRAGLELRRRRRQRMKRPKGLLERHLKFAKPAVALVVIGFAAGPVSAVLLRNWDAFATFHGWVGGAAALCFATAGFLGWRLQQGDRRALVAHGALGLAAVLIAALAALAGFVLLP